MNGSTLSPGYSGIERRRHGVLPYFGEERRSSVADSHALDDEAFLLRRAATGDREAFVRLYDRFVDQVFKYIYFNVGHRSVAEQLTARVFMSVWQGLQQGAHANLSFGTWLYRLAHDVVAVYRQVPTKPAQEGDGREESRLSQQKESVSALAQLADEQRQVLILRFLVGCNTEQVAQILGKQPAAIRTLQHRGLDGLGAILRKGAEK
jgi:RNA polymerase sigma-70 factor (ECF subfamily)